MSIQPLINMRTLTASGFIQSVKFFDRPKVSDIFWGPSFIRISELPLSTCAKHRKYGQNVGMKNSS